MNSNSNSGDESFLMELNKTLKYPWKSFAFKIYFFGVVLLIGGLGIIITICQEMANEKPNLNNISGAFITTAFTMIAASLIDINLSFDFENKASLSISTILVVAISAALIFLTYYLPGAWSFVPSFIGYLISLLIWILANAYNDKLNDSTYQKKLMDKTKTLSKNWD